MPSSRTVAPIAAIATLTIGAALSSNARADPPLDERHDDAYYLARATGAIVATGFALTATAMLRPAPPEPAPHEWLGIDDAVRGHLSASASSVSDVTLFTTIGLPLGAHVAGGFDTRLTNTSILYAEVLATNLLLNTVTKYTLPRLRPYNYRTPPATAYVASQGVDGYLSFYSGHTSTSFAAALAGSYLFAAAHPDAAVRHWLWGTEMTLATATAILRVRAGKHFYSDVAVGTAVGTVLGLGIPLLEGVHYRPSETEIAFAAGGVAVGGIAAIALPLADDVSIAFGRSNFRAQMLPSIGPRSVGLSMNGRF
jgi:membrane-associated phospholipid phosphatase